MTAATSLAPTVNLLRDVRNESLDSQRQRDNRQGHELLRSQLAIAERRIRELVDQSGSGPTGWRLLDEMLNEEKRIRNEVADRGEQIASELPEWFKNVVDNAGLKDDRILLIVKEQLRRFMPDLQLFHKWANVRSFFRRRLRAERSRLNRATEFIESSPFMDEAFKKNAREQLAIHSAGLDLLFKKKATDWKRAGKEEGFHLGGVRGPWASPKVQRAVTEIYRYVKVNAAGLKSDYQRHQFIAELLSRIFPDFTPLTRDRVRKIVTRSDLG